jgi:hypothetical protein
LGDAHQADARLVEGFGVFSMIAARRMVGVDDRLFQLRDRAGLLPLSLFRFLSLSALCGAVVSRMGGCPKLRY